jgi:hypothetical protein
MAALAVAQARQEQAQAQAVSVWILGHLGLRLQEQEIQDILPAVVEQLIQAAEQQPAELAAAVQRLHQQLESMQLQEQPIPAAVVVGFTTTALQPMQQVATVVRE